MMSGLSLNFSSAALTTDAIARQQAEVALNLLQSAAQLSFKG